MVNGLWDEPWRCAQFIERFTSHRLQDALKFNLHEFSRSDLEGIIHLLHGYFTFYVLKSPPETGEILKCSMEEVLKAMNLGQSFSYDGNEELSIDDELWARVKNDPVLLKSLVDLQNNIKKC